ncbi:MAG TPA: hypothetical protein VEK07_23085 [Polyangiaceae bacterium]|nr:hypothetical protein [Polyangiaceae bacterium]
MPGRSVAVTWNPAGLGWGRLSANAEIALAPHHALIVSASTLVFQADRGSSRDLLSQGFGFASSTSFGLGGEIGYHYWLRGLPSLSGPFVGPSFVFGTTTHANVGDTTNAQGYWGLALDVGLQEQLFGGFTAGAGLGIELVDMAAVTALVPRVLAQVGWSF